ncbi:MAG: TetR/AcrR family transcriptional regulator [Clostridia bacterium]|nr:TetR/AcrR family transcriptional regulator [Clostridia bacterium]
MPAKKQVTKGTILEAAFELVREKGMDALNMRDVAQKCNCSTQPIYLSFKGMDELKAEVAQKAVEYFYKYIENEIALNKYIEYKAVGMGYIRFAKEEKELFQFLFMERSQEKLNFSNDSFEKAVDIIMKNYSLTEQEAVRLQAEMWIFVHGFATMYATEYFDWDWETVSSMLTDAFFGFTSRIKKEK